MTKYLMDHFTKTHASVSFHGQHPDLLITCEGNDQHWLCMANKLDSVYRTRSVPLAPVSRWVSIYQGKARERKSAALCPIWTHCARCSWGCHGNWITNDHDGVIMWARTVVILVVVGSRLLLLCAEQDTRIMPAPTTCSELPQRETRRGPGH